MTASDFGKAFLDRQNDWMEEHWNMAAGSNWKAWHAGPDPTEKRGYDWRGLHWDETMPFPAADMDALLKEVLAEDEAKKRIWREKFSRRCQELKEEGNENAVNQSINEILDPVEPGVVPNKEGLW